MAFAGKPYTGEISCARSEWPWGDVSNTCTFSFLPEQVFPSGWEYVARKLDQNVTWSVSNLNFEYCALFGDAMQNCPQTCCIAICNFHDLLEFTEQSV